MYCTCLVIRYNLGNLQIVNRNCTASCIIYGVEPTKMPRHGGKEVHYGHGRAHSSSMCLFGVPAFLEEANVGIFCYSYRLLVVVVGDYHLAFVGSYRPD